MSGLYVYALVERSHRRMQIEGHRIEFVPASGIHAAIERLPRPPDLTESTLRLQHRIVVKLSSMCDPILPARFGAWVDLTELETIVRLRRRSLDRAFDLVRDRQQMTIRIFSATESATEGAVSSESGLAYLERRRAATRPRPSTTTASIQRAVKAIVDDERIDPGAGRLQATLHHLVKRGRSRTYLARLNRLRPSVPAADDEIVVSGPWPPFAFTPDLWS
jgi:hypothetical protein